MTGEGVQVKDVPKPPQNPLSAYAFFFKETQASIKSQQPDATFESVSKIVETMWQALEEGQKEKYRKMNETDKERFAREKEAYDRVQGQGVRVAQQGQHRTEDRTPPGPPGPSQETLRCIRQGCSRPSVRNVEWEDEYCSNQCVVLHCDSVFKEWVRAQTNAA